MFPQDLMDLIEHAFSQIVQCQNTLALDFVYKLNSLTDCMVPCEICLETCVVMNIYISIANLVPTEET